MNPARWSPVSSVVLLLLAAALPACAGATPEPRYVRAADLGTMPPLAENQPLIIEFQEGEVIPLHFTLKGPFVSTPEGAPPIALRVLRHFFVRLDKNGVRSSADGKHFDWKSVEPGQFQFGVGATKEAGVQANITIKMPTPPGLGK